MNDWATRRKNIYLGFIALILASSSAFIFWKFWYAAPSCFDGFKNGDESGIDCGGSCSLICRASVITPVVSWDPRLFEISSNIWSVVVYVENPNVTAWAKYAPYTFTLYDQNNKVLATREGATILPKNKTTGIFEGGILITEGVPKRATFEFGNNIVWEKNILPDPEVVVTHTPLLRLDSNPRIEANVANKSDQDIKNIELVATVFDGADNTIAASRTFLEKIKRNEDANIFFTWPKPFDLGSKVCEKSADIVLLLDRSGSMASLALEPPQPLTDAKEAAASFVDRLTVKDQVSVISFATKPKEPIELGLTNDFGLAKKMIDLIKIEKDGTQFTNLFDSLRLAWQELVSVRANENSSKIAILLTDGVANNPRDPKGRSEVDDIKYAENLALGESANMKASGLKIYTIGLGEKINELFLKKIASEETDYFYAPSATNLEKIYENISSSICKEVPARIDVTYRIFGDSL